LIPMRPRMEPWVMYRKEKNLPIGIAQLIGNNIKPDQVDEETEEWKLHRHTISDLLKPAFISKYTDRIAQVGQNLITHIEKQQKACGGSLSVPQLASISQLYGYEAFSAILLGKKGGVLGVDKIEPQIEQFIEATKNMWKTSLALVYGPPDWVTQRTPALIAHHAAWDQVFDLASKIIETKNRGERYTDDAPDFLDHMSNVSKLNDKEKLVMMMELLLAGVDTTASSFQFAFHHLASNPIEGEVVYDQIQSVTKGKLVNEETLKQLSSVRNFVLESNRVTPVLLELGRSFHDEIAIAGYKIPPFTTINTSVYAVARDDRNFKEAGKFCPARHNQEKNPFAVNTFGHGSRMCPGRRVAEMEIYVALASAIQKFKVSSSHPGVPQVVSTILMTPDMSDPRTLTFTRR